MVAQSSFLSKLFWKPKTLPRVQTHESQSGERQQDPRYADLEAGSSEQLAPSATPGEEIPSLWPLDKRSCVGLAVYLAIGGCIAVWQYFYIDVQLHPVPRRFINSSQARYQAYSAFMFVFGAAYSFVSFFFMGGLALVAVWGVVSKKQEKKRVSPLVWFAAIVLPVVALVFTVFPTFGTLIIEKPVGRAFFPTACNSFGPAQVVLDGHGFREKNPSIPDRAIFSTIPANGSPSAPLFTFNMRFPNISIALFSFALVDAVAPLPAGVLPELRSVQYDFHANTIVGNCSDPSTSEQRVGCLSGTFHLEPTFSVDLYYDPTLSGVPTRLQSSNVEPGYLLWEGEPGVIVHTVSTDGKVTEQTMLKTSLKHPDDRTRMKVCLCDTSDAGATGGPTAGADVIAVLGLLMNAQSDYSRKCLKTRRGKCR